MKLASLLIVVLSNHGYWIGGQPQTVTLHSAVQGGLPRAELVYELKIDGARLDSGKVAVLKDAGEATVRLNVPKVRVRISLHLIYRLVAADNGKELEAGDVSLSVFPDDLMKGIGDRVGKKRLVVWDDPEGLPKFLDRVKVPYVRISSAGKLQFEQCDIVMVAGDRLDNSPFSQSPLLNLARAGASVMLLRQTQPTSLLGFTLATRRPPAALEWRIEHPLLAGFEKADLQSWIADVSSLNVVQLPADEPALEVAYYPPETPSEEPAPIDAVIMTQSIGKGRIVLCQLPLGDWNTDPRSQMLLSNAIDYLLTRPEPTPRPSMRAIEHPVATQPVPSIPISPGENP